MSQAYQSREDCRSIGEGACHSSQKQRQTDWQTLFRCCKWARKQAGWSSSATRVSSLSRASSRLSTDRSCRQASISSRDQRFLTGLRVGDRAALPLRPSNDRTQQDLCRRYRANHNHKHPRGEDGHRRTLRHCPRHLPDLPIHSKTAIRKQQATPLERGRARRPRGWRQYPIVHALSRRGCI